MTGHLLDPLHAHHDRAHRWFEARGGAPWHTCPLVQNGVVRVVSHPRYPNSQPAPVVLESLGSLLETGGHTFLPDSASLVDGDVARERVTSSAQVTDPYLLLLARSHRVSLATFDTRIVTSAVPDGDAVVLQVP
mgnify:CR=1 FL=1